jgi:hypothetical protein
MQPTQPTKPTKPTQPDLVKNVAILNHLIAKYNQLYKTYLQQVAAEANKKTQRKYPYNIINPNEFKNNLTPAYPFPSNGTEDACFKSCVDNDSCVYALYSKSGCGIDCNPNKCLLYGANADGVAPVKELPSELSAACPVSGDSAGTDAWCKTFNHPVTNAIIPALVLRLGNTDWRSLAMQMPKATVNAADAPMTVDLTTNVQTWGPDSQFSDVNYAPTNEISLQFRFFAEYWLNAYGITSGSAPIVTAQGIIGTFTFAKLTKPGSDGTTSYKGTLADKDMLWNSAEPSSGGAAAGLKTAAMLATTTSESAKFNYNYSAFEKPAWRIEQNVNAMSTQLPPQLARMSIPSWQFLGMQDSAEACQSAATDDPDHVYSVATYYNASYDNPKNGNNAFARMCYGHVAGAPSSTASSAKEDNVQTMTPPHGLTKLGGEDGIAILKKMYQLNKQIVALTDELKISGASANVQSVKESFTQRSDSDDATIAALSRQFKTDEANLNAAIQSHDQLTVDEKNAKQLLLQSRIKFGVALVIGLVLAFFAFRVLTADELPSTIKTEIGMNGANSGSSSGSGSSSSSGSGSGSNLDMDSTY